MAAVQDTVTNPGHHEQLLAPAVRWAALPIPNHAVENIWAHPLSEIVEHVNFVE